MSAMWKHAPALVRVIYVLAGVVALGVLSLWVLPALLTRQPSHGMTASARLHAVNDVRAPLVAFLVAIGAAGTVIFTGRTYVLNREGHVTDRYTKAVSQLGDASSPVRIGGVYALERIGNDSPKDRTTIIYVLGTFIRERSRSCGTGQTILQRMSKPACGSLDGSSRCRTRSSICGMLTFGTATYPSCRKTGSSSTEPTSTAPVSPGLLGTCHRPVGKVRVL